MDNQNDNLIFNNLEINLDSNGQCLAFDNTSVTNFYFSFAEDKTSQNINLNVPSSSENHNDILFNLSTVANFIEKKFTPSQNIAEEITNSISELNKFASDYVTKENMITLATFALQGYLTYQVGGVNLALLVTHFGLSIAEPYIDSYWKSYTDSLEDGSMKEVLSSIKLGNFLKLGSATQIGISNGIKAYSLFKDSSLLNSFLNSDFGMYVSSLPGAKYLTFGTFQSYTAKSVSVLFTDHITEKFKSMFWGSTTGIMNHLGYTEFTSPEFKYKPLDFEKAILDVVKKVPEGFLKHCGVPMPVYIAAGEVLKDCILLAKDTFINNNSTIFESYNSTFSYESIEKTRDFFSFAALKGGYETIGRSLAPKYAINHFHSSIYLSTKEFFKVAETGFKNKFCKTYSCWKNAYYLTGWQYKEDLDNLDKIAA